MLRNNTILNIIPGVPWQDKDMMEGAKGIIDKFFEDVSVQRKQLSTVTSPSARQAIMKQIEKLSANAQSTLIKKGYDLRYAGFKQDLPGFLSALQLVINRVGTAVFGLGNGDEIGRFITDAAGVAFPEAARTRGFKVWVEKGSSVSESIENTFNESVLSSTINKISGLAKQLRFVGQGIGLSTANLDSTQIFSENEQMQSTGQVSNIASKALSGSNFDFPQVFDESKFNRSYEVSFRFISPRGDDRSVLNHVLIPFLFLFTCAAPRQEGVNGHISPFLVQVDAPGFFSCPMGVVTSFSFRKGGDELMFNNRGLPLIIEGSMTITDLYSSLSLPLTYSQFGTNFGTSAFLNNLGGLSLYATIDNTLKNRFTNFVRDGITSVLHPYNIINSEINSLKRYFGIF